MHPTHPSQHQPQDVLKMLITANLMMVNESYHFKVFCELTCSLRLPYRLAVV